MRIAYFANNWLGWKIADWFRDQRDDIAAVVLHPPERRRYGPEILEAVGISERDALDGSRLVSPDTLAALRESRAQIALSANFGYRLDAEIRAVFPMGCINVHTALLPHNRGAHPNVWSIVEGSPAGATIHYMDEGLDTGDIVSQRPVEVEPTDTGESLYKKLVSAALELFVETWPAIREGRAERIPQDRAAGTFHRVRDLASLDRIDLARSYKAGDLLNILRARTFPPYPGAYFLQNGRRIYVELKLTARDEKPAAS